MPSAACEPRTPSVAPERFEDVVLPHIDAAYRLARWLMRNEEDAEDAVQESLLRAFRYFRTFAGGHGRAWFLRIVRNTCWGWRAQAISDPFDEEQHSLGRFASASDPETLLLKGDAALLVERAMNTLSVRSRDVLVFRELQGMSYRELSEVLGVPLGTVMSSLWRARQALRGAVDDELKQPRRGARRRARRGGADTDGRRGDARARRAERDSEALDIEKENHEV